MHDVAFTLDDLALKFATDKSSAHHNYTAIYPRYFDELRDKHIMMVELGVQTGASLRMWDKYFCHPERLIYGIDNDLKQVTHRASVPSRIKLYEADQAKPPWNFGGLNRQKFDIVIDDASHLSSKTIASFVVWWPWLKPGGFYVVEDTHASYQSDFYGHTESNPNPDTLTIVGEPTTMQFLRRLADEVNKNTVGIERIPPEYQLGYDLDYIHFWPDLVFIKKAGG